MSNLHAHISQTSSDCDGRYENDYVIGLTAEEFAESQQAVNDFHAITFRERVMCSLVHVTGGFGTLVVHSESGEWADRMAWSQNTEEGFRHNEAVFCEDESCDPEATRHRDHSAEAMGY